jgi:hypothetical protein
MRGEKNGTILAAICRKICAWVDKGGLSFKGRLSNAELERVFLSHDEELIRKAALIASAARKSVDADPSMIGFAYWMFVQARPRKAVAFFNTLMTGENAGAGDPPWALRERLARERRKDRHWNPDLLFSFFVRAWNTYDKGEKLGKLGIKQNADGGYTIPTIRGLGREQGGRGKPEEV